MSMWMRRFTILCAVLSLRKRSQLYKTLVTVLRAGMPLSQLLGPQLPSLSLQPGESLTVALDRAGLLPEDELAVLAVGEEAGKLEACAKLLAEHTAHWHQLHRQVWAAARYPLLLLLLLPFLSNVPALVLGTTSVVAFVVWSLMPLALVAAGWGALTRLMRAGGRRRAFSVSSRLPLIGPVMTMLAQLQFLTLSAVMVRAGIGLRDSFRRLEKYTDNPALAQDLVAWDALLEGGAPLSESFSVLQSLDLASTQLLSTAARTGQLDTAMDTAAGYTRIKLDGHLKTVQRLLPVLLLLVMMMASAC